MYELVSSCIGVFPDVLRRLRGPVAAGPQPQPPASVAVVLGARRGGYLRT